MTSLAPIDPVKGKCAICGSHENTLLAKDTELGADGICRFCLLSVQIADLELQRMGYARPAANRKSNSP